MDEYRILIAKTEKNSFDKGLPLWMHLRDTVEVMGRLIEEWISDAAISAAALDRESFSKVALFNAAVHDIGKATSYFQSKAGGFDTQTMKQKRKNSL